MAFPLSVHKLPNSWSNDNVNAKENVSSLENKRLRSCDYLTYPYSFEFYNVGEARYN